MAQGNGLTGGETGSGAAPAAKGAGIRERLSRMRRRLFPDEDPVIRKTRRSIVAVIMLIAGSILVASLASSSLSSQSSARELVNDAMRHSLLTGVDDNAPSSDHSSDPIGMDRFPVLWVDIDEDGTMTSSNLLSLDFDTDVVADCLVAASEALSSESGVTDSKPIARGDLPTDHVTWCATKTAYGSRVVIASTESIDEMCQKQAYTSAAYIAGSLLLLLVASEFLSYRIMRPIEASWERERRFVADASHELKTPLSVIIADTQILQSEKLPKKSQQWVSGIADESERMKGLVESMLDLARAGEASQTMLRQPVEMKGLIENVTMQFDAVAFERGNMIETELADGIVVDGDPQQLDRLVRTLVDNACKYAAEDTPIDVCMRMADKRKAQIEVHNQGDPIPAADLPHVFDRFWRSSESRARTEGDGNTSGYGLGLAIAKGIADGHGGKIAVKSDEKSGTTFTVTLPCAQQQR